MIPHKKNNYGYIVGRFGELVELLQKQKAAEEESKAPESEK